MRRYEVYKNIRKRAVIFGLPISLIALMMVSVIASLLIIIFSFSFMMIISILIFQCDSLCGLVKIDPQPTTFSDGESLSKNYQ